MNSIRSNGIVNCDHPNAKHCRTRSRAYNSWRGITQRCLNPKNKAWPDYGGRGITVCRDWLTFEGFYRDMGDAPPGGTIERINVNDGYYPENCRWATLTEQSRNKRNSLILTFGGEALPLVDWAARIGCRPGLIRKRLRIGWSVEEALTTPRLASRKGRPNKKSKLAHDPGFAARLQREAGQSEMFEGAG